MILPIPKSPFPVVGRLAKCWLFTFREPAGSVAPLLPRPLELIVRDGFAFWNVVVCEIEQMRPAGLPAFLGVRSRQVAYRLYARWRPNGMPIDGLHFLRSDCNSLPMAWAGGLFTDFKFRRGHIDIETGSDRIVIDVAARGANARCEIEHANAPALDPGSPFDSLYEAKAVLAYKPAALAPAGPSQVRVLSITRDDTAWTSRIVHVTKADFEFLRGRPGLAPEICYEVDPIDYRWNAARTIAKRPASSSSISN